MPGLNGRHGRAHSLLRNQRWSEVCIPARSNPSTEAVARKLEGQAAYRGVCGAGAGFGRILSEPQMRGLDVPSEPPPPSALPLRPSHQDRAWHRIYGQTGSGRLGAIQGGGDQGILQEPIDFDCGFDKVRVLFGSSVGCRDKWPLTGSGVSKETGVHPRRFQPTPVRGFAFGPASLECRSRTQQQRTGGKRYCGEGPETPRAAAEPAPQGPKGW